MEVQLRSSLEVVPLDVISEIGKHLDIKSITRFGSTKKNYRKFLIDNPQNTDMYRTIYFYQYEPDRHINNESKVDWPQLCRSHCYNRLKVPAEDPSDSYSSVKLTVDCVANTITYDCKNGLGSSGDYRAVACHFPLQPLFCNGTVGYYEMTVTAKDDNGGYVNFGLTENGLVQNGRAIGWYADYMWFGYHGDDGNAFDSAENKYSGFHYGPAWLRDRSEVTVGCLIDFKAKEIAYTVDGKCYRRLNTGITPDLIHRLHPVVAGRENSVLEFNFGGQPFVFDLNELENGSSRDSNSGAISDEDKDENEESISGSGTSEEESISGMAVESISDMRVSVHNGNTKLKRTKEKKSSKADRKCLTQ